MKRRKIFLTAIILALVLLIGGMLAYFTDSENTTNEFTLGEVDISLSEPSWTGSQGSPVEILPGQTVAKDPTVTNDGASDVYAFAQVVFPYASVTTEGSSQASAQELYSYSINDEWVEVGSAVIDATNHTSTHLYAYVGDPAESPMKALSSGDSTATVFDNVTLKNVTNPTELSGISLDIDVTAEGIQVNGLPSSANTPTAIHNLI